MIEEAPEAEPEAENQSEALHINGFFARIKYNI